MSKPLTFREYQALVVIKSDCKIMGGWIWWGKHLDSKAVHGLIKKGMVIHRNHEGFTQLNITQQGVSELVVAAGVYNGSPVQ